MVGDGTLGTLVKGTEQKCMLGDTKATVPYTPPKPFLARFARSIDMRPRHSHQHPPQPAPLITLP